MESSNTTCDQSPSEYIKQLELDCVLKEAACAELSFALGVAYAACKENGVTITEDCERTIVAALNNEAGKALLSHRDTLQAELARVLEVLGKVTGMAMGLYYHDSKSCPCWQCETLREANAALQPSRDKGHQFGDDNPDDESP